MKTPKFVKAIRRFGDVVIGLVFDDDIDRPGVQFMEDDANGIYQDFRKPLTEKQLLNILSQAYAMGYEVAMLDAQESLKRCLYERKTPHAPRPRISRTEDHRKMYENNEGGGA